MSRERFLLSSRHVDIPTSALEESHMFRLHRLAPAVAVALATAALLAPSAQALRAVSGGASGGGLTAIDRHAHDTPLANPVAIPTTGQSTTTGVAKSDRESGATGTDWNAVFAGAAGSALIIAMCAGGLSLVRRRTVAA
jgi:hypothetical protein